MKIKFSAITFTVGLLFLTFSYITAFALETVEILPIADVALNKPVYVSSIYDATNTDKTYMVDNEEAGYPTYWQPSSSEAASANEAIVDLTQKYSISRLEIDMTLKKGFLVSVSNDMENWLTIHSQGDTAFDGNTFILYPDVSQKYQFVRLTRSDVSAETDEFKVYSFKAYAPADYNLEELAEGKPVTTHTSGQKYEKGEHVVDRDFNSMVFASKNGTQLPYVTIDLEAPEDIRRIEFMQAMADTSYYNKGIQPDGEAIREGKGSDKYEVYLSNENVTPDVFMANAEKVAEYKRAENWGVSHSITSFDIKASKPYRYVHVVQTTSNVKTMRFSEIFVYSKESASSSLTSEKENILLNKTCVSQSGNNEAYKVNDGDESSSWVISSSDDYATFGLTNEFNIKSLDLKTDGLPSDFEIWGGKSQDFLTDETKIRLYDGESLISDVNVENIIEYITVKPSITASFPINLNELNVYTEKGIRMLTIVKEKDSYIDIGDSVSPAALQIYFNNPSNGSNAVIFGGKTEDELSPIAKLGARTTPSSVPYTVTLNEQQSEYRYFKVVKEEGTLRGGVNSGGVYSFYETDENIDVNEIIVYVKAENILPPQSELTVISAEAVDKDGNLISDLSGENAGARVKIKNTGTETQKAVVICALTDKDNLIADYVFQSVELTSKEEKTVTVIVDNISDEACGLKFFIWKDLQTERVPHTVHRTYNNSLLSFSACIFYFHSCPCIFT